MIRTMVDLTVMFENPNVEPMTFVTGPYEEGDDVRDAIADLRAEAEIALHGDLDAGRCFYRFMSRDEP